MSLFSFYSEQKKSYVDPQSVNIEGEVNGLFYSGSIEASFKNTDHELDKYIFEIGNDVNDQIGFHDLNIEIDGSKYKIKMQELKEARSSFNKMDEIGEQAVFGKGDDNYSKIYITNVLQNQTVTVSLKFELPASLISENIICLMFPLKYPNDEGYLKCLLIFIKSLPENCYFNIVRFGSNYVPLFEKPVLYTKENVDIALNLANSLKADLGCTNLSEPLSHVFKNQLSVDDKLRRVFVLTDGYVDDKSAVINLVNQNSITSVCSAIGNDVDRDLVNEIGKKGNGFIDFVLEKDDMKSKVINQLTQSLSGLCQVNISIEENEEFEIVPSFQESQLSFISKLQKK